MNPKDNRWINQSGFSTPSDRTEFKTYCSNCGKFCLKVTNVWAGNYWVPACSETCITHIQNYHKSLTDKK